MHRATSFYVWQLLSLSLFLISLKTGVALSFNVDRSLSLYLKKARMPLGLGSSGGYKKVKGMAANVSGGRGGSSSSSGQQQPLTLKKKLSALIVDDNKVNRKIHKALLAKLGVECAEAENGKEAVDLCRAGSVFDLILMDMEMPVMNGPEATRALRAMGVSSKILGVTGNSRSSDRDEFMSAGIDGFYLKPITHSNIISVLQELGGD